MSAIRVLMRLRELLDVLVASPADGDVLTYETASSKWKNLPAAGGGSQPVTDRAIYGGNDVSIPNSGAPTRLTWDTLASGTALLDISAPAFPTVVTAGVYAVAVCVVPSSSMTDGKAYEITLTLGTVVTVKQTVAVNDAADFDTFGSTGATYYLEAGDLLSLAIQQADAGAINFHLESAVIQRLS